MFKWAECTRQSMTPKSVFIKKTDCSELEKTGLACENEGCPCGAIYHVWFRNLNGNLNSKEWASCLCEDCYAEFIRLYGGDER